MSVEHSEVKRIRRLREGIWLRRSNALTRYLVWLPLMLLVLWTSLPIVWSISASFKDPFELYDSPSLIPRRFQVQSYYKVITMKGFGRWFFNSVLVTCVTTVAPLLISILAAYAFARYAFRWRSLLLLLILIPRILPRVGLIVPLYDLILRMGLVNTYSALFITYTASAIPLSTWILTGFFAAVPRVLEESAQIDGATLPQALLHVVLPVAWPGILTVAVLCMREAWNEFAFVLSFMDSSHMRTLPYQLYLFKDSMGIQDWSLYNAFTILTVLPLLLIYVRLERYVVKSIMTGAIK